MTWATGRCSCGQVEYELTGGPLITHACHCLDCQRNSGGPFVINLWIEAERFQLERGSLRTCTVESGSGKGQELRLECYRRTDTFEQATVPDALKNEHRLKPGTWGRLVVIRGSVDFWLSGADGPEQSVQSGTFRWIAPQERHRVEPSADAQFYVEFLRQGKKGE